MDNLKNKKNTHLLLNDHKQSALERQLAWMRFFRNSGVYYKVIKANIFQTTKNCLFPLVKCKYRLLDFFCLDYIH